MIIKKYINGRPLTTSGNQTKKTEAPAKKQFVKPNDAPPLPVPSPPVKTKSGCGCGRK